MRLIHFNRIFFYSKTVILLSETTPCFKFDLKIYLKHFHKGQLPSVA
ncbi:MAG: hypothetical protein RI952_690 [Bacteroidota bacterium]|jgi:hypothetical protein